MAPQHSFSVRASPSLQSYAAISQTQAQVIPMNCYFFVKCCTLILQFGQYLNITVDELIASNPDNFVITQFEKDLIKAYRNSPNMRDAVNRLLEIEANEVIP